MKSFTPFHISTLSNSDLQNQVYEISSKLKNVGIRVCRGGKMQTSSGLFDEMAAAFQFPYYFGENWNALDDCLSDLSWFDAESYVLCIFSAHLILDSEPENRLFFFEMIKRISRGWAGENPNLAIMGRSPLDFKIILQSPSDRVNELERELAELIDGDSGEKSPVA